MLRPPPPPDEHAPTCPPQSPTTTPTHGSPATGHATPVFAEAVPALLAFAFSWPWLTDYSFVAGYGVIAAAFYFHLLALEPARPRLLQAVVATGATRVYVHVDLDVLDPAEMTGVAVGTVKSRANRARARLAEMLGLEEGEEILSGVDGATLAVLGKSGVRAA